MVIVSQKRKCEFIVFDIELMICRDCSQYYVCGRKNGFSDSYLLKVCGIPESSYNAKNKPHLFYGGG